MVWQRFFPKSGGGSVRRWLRLQKALFLKAMDSEHIFKGPITLFDFCDFHDAVDASNAGFNGPGWRISDDEVIGGYSRGILQLVRSSRDLKNVVEGNDPEPIAGNAQQPDAAEEGFTPFIRWKGTLDTRIGEGSRVKRSGFCAIRTPEFLFGADLTYNALELKLRSDGRKYFVNLHLNSMFPGDLYQSVLAIPPCKVLSGGEHDSDGFDRVIFEFRDFLHTSMGGRIKVNQRQLDRGASLDSIGFTLMDGKDGDFQLDLARIRAVNYIGDEILGEDDELAPY